MDPRRPRDRADLQTASALNGSSLTAAWLVVFAFLAMDALSLTEIMAQRRGAII
jgi:hypothetical protein